MIIPQRFHQFEGEHALFLVTGSQHAVWYIAADHTLTKIDTFITKRPKYSDREGHGERRGSGHMFVVGGASVADKQRRVAAAEFLAGLKQALEKSTKQYPLSHLFLFAPRRMRHHIVRVLPRRLAKLPPVFIDGNYVDRPPTDLLKKIVESIKTTRY